MYLNFASKIKNIFKLNRTKKTHGGGFQDFYNSCSHSQKTGFNRNLAPELVNENPILLSFLNLCQNNVLSNSGIRLQVDESGNNIKEAFSAYCSNIELLNLQTIALKELLYFGAFYFDLEYSRFLDPRYTEIVGQRAYEKSQIGSKSVHIDNLCYYENLSTPRCSTPTSYFHTAYSVASILNEYQNVALLHAKQGAQSLAFLKKTEMNNLKNDDEQRTMNFGSGINFPVLSGGYDLISHSANYPHKDYNSFIQTAKQQVANCLNVSVHALSQDVSGLSYSAARYINVQDNKTYKRFQKILINSFLNPFFDYWKNNNNFKYRFIAPSIETIDPKNEMLKDQISLELGLTTRTELAENRGVNFTNNVKILGEEIKLMKQHGILPNE